MASKGIFRDMWRSSASIKILQARASILAKIRQFFEQRGVLEVEVPVLGERGVTDPYLDALTLISDEQKLYLQTSPEFFMKRLLAGGSGDIYYLGKAFRKDETGRIHHPEFTMLEWYRKGFNDRDLITELIAFISALAPEFKIEVQSYRDLFMAEFGLDPHESSVAELKTLVSKRIDISWDDPFKSTWLDLLFTHCIEPKLRHKLIVVYDFPECQSALARVALDSGHRCVAKRFELYMHGTEIANGYWELTNADELRRRFEADNDQRLAMGKQTVAIDEEFLAAVSSGLPDCAGVALGVDRLVMELLGLPSIAQQRCF